MTAVELECVDGIMVITVDNPPVNVLSGAVRQGLLEALEAVAADENIKAAVLACAGRTFIAGADIKEFSRPVAGPTLPDLIPLLEASSKPIVAALHGTALGGGFEVAMACQYRVALSTAEVGLPEVAIGLIPGAGGTQLLPRLIGLEAASELIVNSKRLKAPKALALGAVDKIVEDNLLEEAIAFARSIAATAPPRTSHRSIDMTEVDSDFFEVKRAFLAKKKRGFLAPQRALEAIEVATTASFEDGMVEERKLFMTCKESPQSKALQHLFFAERSARTVPGLSRDLPARPVNAVGIIGTGTMGAGIAMSFARAGIAVTLLDVDSKALDAGLNRIQGNYERSVKSGRMTGDQLKDCMANITMTTDYDALQDCDLIIEAAVEVMAIKETIFKKLGEVAKDGAILASNTSYLDINHLAKVSGRAGDVLGLHFFSPANIMKLLEIVRGDETSGDVLQTALKLAKRIGKIGVVSGVCHGFIGNRMLSCYSREANLAVMEGADPVQVDRALYTFGMAMGPLTVADMAGLDIGYMNRKALDKSQYEATAYEWINRLVEMDRKGLKTGAGIYRYAEGSRTPKDDPLVHQIIADEAAAAGIPRAAISDQEIVERCMLTLINEGATLLGEGIALRASDIDLVYCNGYGFPAYRGGPMHYADHLGLDHVCQRIRHMQQTRGERWWKIAPLLEDLAAKGGRFADYGRQKHPS